MLISTKVRLEQSPEEIRKQVMRIGVNKVFQAEGTVSAKSLEVVAIL